MKGEVLGLDSTGFHRDSGRTGVCWPVTVRLGGRPDVSLSTSLVPYHVCAVSDLLLHLRAERQVYLSISGCLLELKLVLSQQEGAFSVFL